MPNTSQDDEVTLLNVKPHSEVGFRRYSELRRSSTFSVTSQRLSRTLRTIPVSPSTSRIRNNCRKELWNIINADELMLPLAEGFEKVNVVAFLSIADVGAVRAQSSGCLLARLFVKWNIISLPSYAFVDVAALPGLSEASVVDSDEDSAGLPPERGESDSRMVRLGLYGESGQVSGMFATSEDILVDVSILRGKAQSQRNATCWFGLVNKCFVRSGRTTASKATFLNMVKR